MTRIQKSFGEWPELLGNGASPRTPQVLGGKYHIPPSPPAFWGGEIIPPNILFFGGRTKCHPMALLYFGVSNNSCSSYFPGGHFVLGCSQLSQAPGYRVAWGCWGYNAQESQRQVQNPTPGVDFFLSCNLKKKTRIAKLGKRMLNSSLFVPDGFRGCADFFWMHNPPHHVRKPRWLRQGNAATFLTISNQNNFNVFLLPILPVQEFL